MALRTAYIGLSVEGLPSMAARKQEEGWRYVQLLAVNTDDGIDLVYSFMKDGLLENHTITGVKKGTVVPSITDRFIEAFVCENEVHDLFGVDIEGIAIDFKGHFYAVSQNEPMTIISPEQKAARDKAAKAARVKAERARQAAAANASFVSSHPEAKGAPRSATPTPDADIVMSIASSDPERVARIRAMLAEKAKQAKAALAEAEPAAFDAATEEKLAGMDPEKAAKVRAALAAKAKVNLEGMDPQKAERVRAAMEAKARREAARTQGSTTVTKGAELEAKLSQLDPERAAKVLSMLDAQAREKTAQAAHDAKMATLEERLANMDPEKAAKVRAAMAAQEKKAQASAKPAAGASDAGKAGE